MAAEKMTIMKKWIDGIRNDENLDLTEQQIAYIIYAMVTYGLEGTKVNIGNVFGEEFKYLNLAMSNIYTHIDNIQNYAEEKKASVLKYDADRIYELRLEGYTAKEICVMEGYGEDKANNITSNKGWKLAGEELKKRKIQNSGNSVKSVSESVQNNIDSIERNFDF